MVQDLKEKVQKQDADWGDARINYLKIFFPD